MPRGYKSFHSAPQCEPQPFKEPCPDLASHEARRIMKQIIWYAKRQKDSLRLYQALPHCEAFHRSDARQRIIVGSNRSGKTTATCWEIAAAARGEHPYLDYPKGGLEIYLVAKDGRQIGEVWWRKLTGSAFDIIRDTETDEWRTFRPWDKADRERQHEKIPAPPLLPEWTWKGKPVWEDKGLGIPRLLELLNGTRIHFFTGNAKPPMGTAIDLAAFSEEIGSTIWYAEIMARLVQKRGRFIWDATPLAGSEGLYDLHLRAEKESVKERPLVTEHFMHIEANPHIDAQAKQEFSEQLTDPEQHLIRYEGKFPGSLLHIFPEWSLKQHGVELPTDSEGRTMGIPKEWTRYVIVDPGNTVCAVLFAAVPPEKFGEYVYLYDELYLQPCLNADHFADQLQHKLQTDLAYDFIIDGFGSQRTEHGTGETVVQQYARALAKRGVRCHIRGSEFYMSYPEAKAGNLAVHDWLHVRRQTGNTKLRVLCNKNSDGVLVCRLPNFDFEMKHYRKKQRADGVILDEPYGKHDHLVSCLRFLREYDPKWHSVPESQSPRKPDGYTIWKQLKKIDRETTRGREGRDFTNFGPGRGGRNHNYSTRSA